MDFSRLKLLKLQLEEQKKNKAETIKDHPNQPSPLQETPKQDTEKDLQKLNVEEEEVKDYQKQSQVEPQVEQQKSQDQDMQPLAQEVVVQQQPQVVNQNKSQPAPLQEKKTNHLCIERSIQNSIRQTMSVDMTEETKKQKKAVKIIIKQLEKVKTCINNLAAAEKGLEYIQSKLKEHPQLKIRLKQNLKEMQQMMNTQ